MVYQPVNYGINVASANPAQSLMQGLQVGQGLGDALITQPAQAQAAAEAKRLDMAQRQMMQQELMTLQKDPSQARARDLLLRFPQLKEQVSGFMSSFDDEQKKSYLSQMEESAGFLVSGNPQMAAESFKKRAEAAKNSGNQREAEAMTRLAEQVIADPAAVRAQLQMRIEALDPDAGKRLSAFEESRSKVGKEAAETAKIGEETKIKAEEAKQAAAEIASRINLTKAQSNRLYAQTKNDADRLGLDWAKLALDRMQLEEALRAKATTLSESAQKTVATSADAAIKADAMATKMDQVADRFGTMARDGVVSGKFGQLAETAKGFAGMENAVTQARQAFQEIKTSKVLESLPPGTASDVDIALASKPIPEGTTNPAVVESYLRGAAKISRYNSIVERGKAEFVSQNGSVGNARTDLVIGDVRVPQGASYSQYLDALQRKALAKVATPAKKPEPTVMGTPISEITR